ncbi:photosynthetic protein synthase I [Aliiroseovarius sp. S1339]|uniref:cytochrome-c peroxidase n=1 Tax=Aliiroseovarius sp. S1339 TaxID=2936990 RepID=UPI0020BDB5E6|nr:cytochrome c peroxidase [Aliiroseovarius sp. S1339]MCK8464017.1 photosynthetic protein synthase I [Aliiroseovarius sp. S1339]
MLKGTAALLLVLASAPATGRAADFAPLPAPNEVNQAKAKLGEMLFFDDRLSGDVGNSCSSCHDPVNGWGDGQALSDAYAGGVHFRNAKSLFNTSFSNVLMWDGRLDGADMSTVSRDMMTESHTMHMDSRLAQERLKQVPEYVEMFEEAFGGDPYGGKIYSALGEYLKTIRTEGAPFDAYLNGDQAALSEAATRGMDLFAGKAGCIECHNGPTLSDGGVHATGVPGNTELQEDAERQIIMLRFFATLGTPNYMNLREDAGHYAVTKDDGDDGKFATPSLWDVGQTAPYMHSGVHATLADVVDFYNAGNEQLPALDLTNEEAADLVAFLESLTGDAPNVAVPELPDYAMRVVGEN